MAFGSRRCSLDDDVCNHYFHGGGLGNAKFISGIYIYIYIFSAQGDVITSGPP